MAEPTTTTIGSLWAKLARAGMGMRAVVRDSQHEHFKFWYSSADAVLEVARGPLAAEGVALVTKFNGPIEAVRELKGDKSTRYLIRVPLLFTFIDGETGEREELPWIGEAADGEASGISKALTNALRTFLRLQFQIPQEHDDQHFQAKGRGGGRGSAGAGRAKAAPAMITPELYQQIVAAFQAAGTPEELFAAHLHKQGADVEVGIAEGVASLTRAQAEETLAFLKGLGVPVTTSQEEPAAATTVTEEAAA